MTLTSIEGRRRGNPLPSPPRRQDQVYLALLLCVVAEQPSLGRAVEGLHLGAEPLAGENFPQHLRRRGVSGLPLVRPHVDRRVLREQLGRQGENALEKL